MTNEPMYTPLVTIHWCPVDVKSIRPEWSDELCIQTLYSISSHFEDRCIEMGWEILDHLLEMENPNE